MPKILKKKYETSKRGRKYIFRRHTNAKENEHYQHVFVEEGRKYFQIEILYILNTRLEQKNKY